MECERYWVFAGGVISPTGGMYDFIATADNWGDATKIALKNYTKEGWVQIYDSKEEELYEKDDIWFNAEVTCNGVTATIKLPIEHVARIPKTNAVTPSKKSYDIEEQRLQAEARRNAVRDVQLEKSLVG